MIGRKFTKSPSSCKGGVFAETCRFLQKLPHLVFYIFYQKRLNFSSLLKRKFIAKTPYRNVQYFITNKKDAVSPFYRRVFTV